MIEVKRNILLNPGPATTTDGVKMAQVVPDICPREREFGDVMEFVSRELTTIAADISGYTTVLFGGSGTAVVEAVLCSAIPPGRRVLIVNNGAYGKRMCRIADVYEIDYIEFRSSSIQPIDFAALEERLASEENLSHLAVVHHETTTGLLNGLNELGTLTKKYGLELIVDAMSSFAAVPIDMRRQGLHYLCASSNKNIQGMAGVGFILADKVSLEKLKDHKPRSFYLDLYGQYKNFIDTHQMRFTPPVQTLYALKQAILEAKQEGMEARYGRYTRTWKVLTDALKEMGIGYLVDDLYHGKLITSIFIPEGVDFNDMHDFFYDRGFTIYPGKIAEFNTFRVANIGAIDEKDMAGFLALLKEYLEHP